MLSALLLIALQQQPAQGSTPPSGDTTGYWQQHVRYTIVATLDEAAERVRARGELVYLNRSPDTLREFYVHQYLNAFRPGSKWSAVDQREGRVRFQNLGPNDHGYERFTSVPTFDGTPVTPQYPGGSDSTVARFALPRPLAPGDSVRVAFAWEARPSTTPRRQGRRGRTWDLAQWYPKVAVYDRGGWQPNALIPAGEFYGEFGTYDVTLVLRDDQVVAASGVPVSGDPGYERVRRWGQVRLASDAYGALPPAPQAEVPAGHRAVRWYARDVHHFGWSASPDYIYEGGSYVRAGEHRRAMRFTTWDTVPVHVLYKPGDDSTWGGGRAVERTITALRFLEGAFGPYGYPVISNIHRLDGGGTEFPMLMMNGSPSQGLILHEGGHIYAYGMLANNEWRSGWMDEGLASYLTSWAQNLTPQEQVGRVQPPQRLPEGYRAVAQVMTPYERQGIAMAQLDLAGRAEPIGTNSADFRDFQSYNTMIYSRAELMFGQLRDAIGDAAFREFLRTYYARWAFRHVDEVALRTSAELASGMDLRWFFDQWIRRTGVLDYALTSATVQPRAEGGYVTRARVARQAAYRHPMPVGVRTDSGWTIVRAGAHADTQVVEVVTPQRPIEVRLDPHHTTWDYDRRNDSTGMGILGLRRMQPVFDWPFLEQSHRDRTVAAFTPLVWHSEPLGVVAGVRMRTSYVGRLDRGELGLAFATRNGGDSRASQLHAWGSIENARLPGMAAPLLGHRFYAGFLDGIVRLGWRGTQGIDDADMRRVHADTVTAYVTTAMPTDPAALPVEQWDDTRLVEGGIGFRSRPWTTARGQRVDYRTVAGLGIHSGGAFSGTPRAYVRGELAARARFVSDSMRLVAVRGFLGAAANAPRQRHVFLSSEAPLETFGNHWYRPRDAFLKDGLNATVPGGAGLRGYTISASTRALASVNGEAGRRVLPLGGFARGLGLWANAFADAAVAETVGFLADAGGGIALRGRLYDSDVRLRLDVPVIVTRSTLAVGEPRSFWFRIQLGLGDLWG